jgi:two-component system LytT family response regulator
MKAFLIDDEIDGVEALSSLLAQNCKNVTVIGSETNPAKAVELIRKLQPDLVFLDIQMPGMSGFQLLEKVKDLPFQVIFTTAHNNYAVKAFRHNAVDYLLKPIIISELIEAVGKVNVFSETKSPVTDIGKLLERLAGMQGGNKIAIASMNEIVYVDSDLINRLESDSNYTHIILQDGKKYTSTKTLKEYENMLNPSVFCRVFRTSIVNLRHVDKYVKMDGGYLVMSDGTKVPVSREKRQALLEILASGE